MLCPYCGLNSVLLGECYLCARPVNNHHNIPLPTPPKHLQGGRHPLPLLVSSHSSNNKRGILVYENGCFKHPDCFSCPTPDCNYQYGPPHLHSVPCKYCGSTRTRRYRNGKQRVRCLDCKRGYSLETSRARGLRGTTPRDKEKRIERKGIEEGYRYKLQKVTDISYKKVTDNISGC